MQLPSTFSVASASHPVTLNVLLTILVPGFSERNFGASLSRLLGQEKQREHGRLRDVGLEHVAFDERRAVRDAGFLRPAPRQRHHIGVVLDADRPRAALGSGNHVAAIARPEIHDDVLWRDLRHVEHLFDQLGRRRHPDDVLAGLTGRGFEVVVCAKVVGDRRASSRSTRAWKRSCFSHGIQIIDQILPGSEHLECVLRVGGRNAPSSSARSRRSSCDVGRTTIFAHAIPVTCLGDHQHAVAVSRSMRERPVPASRSTAAATRLQRFVSQQTSLLEWRVRHERQCRVRWHHGSKSYSMPRRIRLYST